MKNKIFEVFVCMLLIGTFFVVTLDAVSADDIVEGDYIYNVDNGKAIIIDYTGAGGAITIPSTLVGYPTVRIGNTTFENCITLTSVTIPDSVITIGGSAFLSCSALASVTLGNSTTTIGNGAFRSCTSLASVAIPDSITNIEDAAFNVCSALTSVTIPNSVTRVGGGAFEDCTSLSTVTIGSSVMEIGDWAFHNCSSLTSITFLGLVSPINIGQNWVLNTHVGIRGHAYSNSNFPPSGEQFNGLTMGTVIGSENKPPVADFTWAPSTPKTNETITFDASASNDLDGSLTVYEWDWNNDGMYEDSHTIPTAAHSWTQAGNYSVIVRVTDNDGVTSIKTITIPISSSGGTDNTNNNGTPGFELVFVIGAIAVVLFLRRKKLV